MSALPVPLPNPSRRALLAGGGALLALAAAPKPGPWAQDFAAVREYLGKDLALTAAARAEGYRRVAALEARGDKLTVAQLTVGVSRIGALADNSHSGLRYSSQRARLPVRLLWLPDALVVARATGEAADLAGARVERLEGLTPDQLFGRIRDLVGGPDVNRRKRIGEWIDSFGILHAAGVAARPESLRLRLRRRDGSTVERRLAMAAPGAFSPTAEDERLWSPEPAPGERGWVPALDPKADLPLYLREADRPFRLAMLPELDAAYVQLRYNDSDGPYDIHVFQEEVTARLGAAGPRHLVADLRFDIGGNLSTTLPFMRGLSGLVRGRTLLLTGPYTYSAGIISAAAVLKGGGDKVTVIGDTVGDRLSFWSEGNNILLPKSGLKLRYTDGQFDLIKGCGQARPCMDSFAKINFVDLTPQRRARLTAADWFAGRDPAMEAVKAALA